MEIEKLEMDLLVQSNNKPYERDYIFAMDEDLQDEREIEDLQDEREIEDYLNKQEQIKKASTIVQRPIQNIKEK